MKKISRVLAVTMAAMMMLTGCSGGGKDVDVAQVAADMVAATTFEDEMRLMLEDVVTNKYDMEHMESYAVYMCPTGGYADEIAVFKAKEGKGEELKNAVTAHVTERKAEFDGYVPAEVQKLEQAQVLAQDDYVALIVAGDTTAAADVFTKAFE